jgi:hypothetical protein
VWLRWRLAVVRARRMFGAARRVFAGGRPAAGVGASFQLEAAAVPVAGVDYDVGELSPELLGRLEGTRAELLDSARAASSAGARRRRGRRRRTFSLTVAALVTLTVLGAGATALMTGSTGVPAVDRLLGIHDSGRDDSDGRPGIDLRPSAAGPVIGLDLPNGKGATRVEGSTYVGPGGRICSATTQFEPDGRRRQGTAFCERPSVLATDLDEAPLKLAAVQVSGVAVLIGLVAADVRDLSGTGPNGALTLRLSKPWRPSSEAIGPVMSFLAVGPVRKSGGSEADEAHRAVIPRAYRFQVKLKNGETVIVRPR